MFTNEYPTITIGDNWYFISAEGIVFYFIVLRQLRSLIVEYADSISDAKNDFFEDGDQFNIDQDFESLVQEIKEELSVETKRNRVLS